MSVRQGAGWLGWTLAGPGLWAVCFAAVYGLHGTGCSLGWTAHDIGPVTLHHAAMGTVWAATLLACLALLLWLPRGPGLPRRLPRIGAWIGLGATLASFVPIITASSC